MYKCVCVCMCMYVYKCIYNFPNTWLIWEIIKKMTEVKSLLSGVYLFFYQF